MCAKIKTTQGDLERYPSWVQCLQLPSGHTYRFSAWLKVQTEPGMKWRPLYYQGELDGTTKGYWPGTQQGSIDWAYWEQEFILPPFEDGQVCFHPIRLESAGTAWFYDARLTLVQADTP
jgi:hypothetical protein